MWRSQAGQKNQHLHVVSCQHITTGAPAAVKNGLRLLTEAAIEKPPFAGPETVLAYLSRYTHRVAISNSRLLRFDEAGVTFRYKNYRVDGADRQQVMTLTADEFIRRFLLHVLPKGFHRIRHYGLLAGATRKARLDHVRQLLGVASPAMADVQAEPDRPPCPCCGGRMVVVETFERQCLPRAPPTSAPSPGRLAS